MVIKITECGIKDFAKTLLLPLINVIITSLLVIKLKTMLGIGIWEFITFSCVGILTYFITTYLLDKFFNYKMYALIKESFQSLKGI